jgi:hypothetical protein
VIKGFLGNPVRSAGPPYSSALPWGALLILLFAQPAFGQRHFERGLIWEDNRYNAIPVRYGSSYVPSSKSLKAYYPKVVIQPNTDFTGVAWASVWNARTAAEAIACNQTDPNRIREIAFAPAYNYAVVRKTSACYEPISMIELLESMVRNGSPYFSEFREFCATELTVDLIPLATKKKLSGFFKLFNTTDAINIKVQSVKSAIASNNAVVIGMICPGSFGMAKDTWQPSEPQPSQDMGGHAICVVGYDDTKFGGAFEVINTWGKDWGVQGFTWIRYKDFANYAQYGFGLFQVGSASCNVPFEGNVSFKLLSGEEMITEIDGAEGQYRFWQSYPTGTTFTIEMSSSLPGYVYSFGVDPRNDLFPLFPRLATTTPITYAPLRAPDDLPAITLTDPPGKNSVYFVFSPYEVDITKAMTKLKGRRVITPTDVQTAIGAMTAEPVQWSEKGLSFSGVLTGPVVMQVVLSQTKK